MNGTRPRLYVGNLPYQLTVDELKDFFAGAGNVTDAAIITDRDTGAVRVLALSNLQRTMMRRAPNPCSMARNQEPHTQGGFGKTAEEKGGADDAVEAVGKAPLDNRNAVRVNCARRLFCIEY